MTYPKGAIRRIIKTHKPDHSLSKSADLLVSHPSSHSGRRLSVKCENRCIWIMCYSWKSWWRRRTYLLDRLETQRLERPMSSAISAYVPMIALLIGRKHCASFGDELDSLAGYRDVRAWWRDGNEWMWYRCRYRKDRSFEAHNNKPRLCMMTAIRTLCLDHVPSNSLFWCFNHKSSFNPEHSKNANKTW